MKQNKALVTKNCKDMEEKKMGFFQNAKQKVLTTAGALVVACNAMTVPVYAAGTTPITQPLDSLKTPMIAVIGAVGLIILAKKVMEFAQAYQQQDSSSIKIVTVYYIQ